MYYWIKNLNAKSLRKITFKSFGYRVQVILPFNYSIDFDVLEFREYYEIWVRAPCVIITSVGKKQ